MNNKVLLFFIGLNENGLIGSTKIYKPESFKLLMNKRVIFLKGYQNEFLKDFKKKFNFSWSEFSEKLNVNLSTLSKSYMFESCNLPYVVFKKILQISDEIENEILKKYNAEIMEEELIIGRKCFGEQKKILDPIKITFRNKNLKLNTSKINYSRQDKIKKIKLPTELTPELAEEIGMHFGDGFLSNKRYDYRLKGNPKDEKEYYQNYIKPLFKKLYNFDLNLKESYKSFGFELYSQALWEFKTKVIGIISGRKEKISIPSTLKVNNQKILCAFIRGLFDTDGSICFKTKYGYKKYYPEIGISLTSKNLIKEVGEILKMLGFNPGVYFNDKYGRISIYGINALKKYENLINWSSQKNLKRLIDWKKRYPKLNNMAIVVKWQNTRLWSVRPEFDSRLSLSSNFEINNGVRT